MGVGLPLINTQFSVLDDAPAGTSQLVIPIEIGDPPVFTSFVVDSLEYSPTRVAGTFTVLDGRLFLRGDALSDGTVHLTDAIAVLGYLFSGEPLECLDGADFDDNGSLGLPDALQLLDFLFASGPPPAPPWPNAGIDITPDNLQCN